MDKQKLLVIRLDDARYGAGPGTVIATVEGVDEYLVMLRDRDGAHDPMLRLWQGNLKVGDRAVGGGS